MDEISKAIIALINAGGPYAVGGLVAVIVGHLIGGFMWVLTFCYITRTIVKGVIKSKQISRY